MGAGRASCGAGSVGRLCARKEMVCLAKQGVCIGKPASPPHVMCGQGDCRDWACVGQEVSSMRGAWVEAGKRGGVQQRGRGCRHEQGGTRMAVRAWAEQGG